MADATGSPTLPHAEGSRQFNGAACQLHPATYHRNNERVVPHTLSRRVLGENIIPAFHKSPCFIEIMAAHNKLKGKGVYFQW